MLESKIKDQSLQIHSLKLPESPHCAHLRTHPETYTVCQLPYSRLLTTYSDHQLNFRSYSIQIPLYSYRRLPFHTIQFDCYMIFPGYRTPILSQTDSISRVPVFASRPSRTRERTRCRPPSPIPPTIWSRPVNPTTRSWRKRRLRIRSRPRSRTWSQTWPCSSSRNPRWQSQQSEALAPNLLNGLSPFPFVSQ